MPPSWHPAGSVMLGKEKGKLAWDLHVGDGSLVITAEKFQPSLFQHPLPATVFGRVAYFGTWAADLETSDVLWRLPVKKPRFAAVPADRFVLMVDGTTLRAFREKGSGGTTARVAKGAKPAFLAVGQDGDVTDGDLSVSFDEGLLHEGKRSHPLGRYYLVEDKAGACIWAARLRGTDSWVRVPRACPAPRNDGRTGEGGLQGEGGRRLEVLPRRGGGGARGQGRREA